MHAFDLTQNHVARDVPQKMIHVKKALVQQSRDHLLHDQTLQLRAQCVLKKRHFDLSSLHSNERKFFKVISTATVSSLKTDKDWHVQQTGTVRGFIIAQCEVHERERIRAQRTCGACGTCRMCVALQWADIHMKTPIQCVFNSNIWGLDYACFLSLKSHLPLGGAWRLREPNSPFSLVELSGYFLSCWIHFLYFRVYYFEMDNFSDWNLTCKWQLSSEIAMILWNHHLIITYDHDWGIKDNAVKKNECHVTSSPTCYFSSVLNNPLHMKWHRDSLSIDTEIACMVRCKNHAFFDD